MYFSVLKHSLRWMAVFVLIVGSVQSAQAQSVLDVVVHYVDGKPAANQPAYEVTAYVSVTDAERLPVLDLQAANFTLAEDSQQVQLLTADPAFNDPLNLVLLLDTSGSMSGRGMEAAISSSANFLSRLSEQDRVAVITFDETNRVLTPFTNDHTGTRDKLQSVKATRNSGTCLYDAAYQAVDMASEVTFGRRYIILFTDGVDVVLGGAVCSTHTKEEVVDHARENATRVPIFTIGMGEVDRDVLTFIAQNTGGRAFFADQPDDLNQTFQDLTDSIGSQFALRYLSVAGPGPHILSVAVQIENSQGQGTRNFRLPNLPLTLSISDPVETAEVTGVVTVHVNTSGQGDPIQSVIVQINGNTVGADDSPPYEIPVDFSPYSSGPLTLDVIAQAADGHALARISRTVVVGAPTPTATVAPTETAAIAPVPTVAPPPIETKRIDLFVIGIFAVVGLVLLGLLISLVVLLRRRRDQQQRDQEWARQVGGVGETPTPRPTRAQMEQTLDALEVGPDALGLFVVLQSDDSSMLGHRFEILHQRTSLGRSAENDIPFPKDSPVSRRHAILEEKNGGLWISEVESEETSGNRKRPTYGTFVNDNPIGTQPVLLKSRDEVRLGKRVRMLFEPGKKLMGGEADTMDQLNLGDSEPTQEG